MNGPSTSHTLTFASPTPPVLQMRGIGKSFPGVRALDGVTFDVLAGEVHALVGENGAGKSTLMKILAGALRADEGEILIDGRKMTISSPKEAELAGIGMVYQELNLVPQLSVSDNIVLGIEPQHGLLLDRASAQRQAASILKELGIDLPLNEPVRNLSVGQQQVVEIAKAMLRRARIIVLDEPTASLSENETTHLFNLIAKLKADGAAVIYISHRLEELAQICQRVTVLRDGATIETRNINQMPQDEIVRLMVGRKIDKRYPDIPPVAPDAAEVLTVDALGSAKVQAVSLSVKAGEIVGIAGLVGAGRTRSCAPSPVPTVSWAEQ